jgi:hypothetical protein
MSTNAVEVIPGAWRLIKSLRDMGYEFTTAIADIVDNSIAARSTVVRISVVWNGEHSYVLVADNGDGMAPVDLREAMRYGAGRDYETEDLGKFGLGLKTASMSQCTKLTVATRQNERRVDIASYCWDLEHVSSTNRWEILPVASQNLPAKARQHLKETTGTVVVWERLDRILNYKVRDGAFAHKHLMAMCRELEQHLAMVFHRFLAGEVRGKKLSIYINDTKVLPWDPFARSETKTEKLDSVAIRVDGSTAKTDIIIEPFVLPPQSEFSSTEAHTRTSGPNKWNRQQGFYIYRADRMIQSGGWSGIRTFDEHLKLARVALYFSPRLDDEFKINVAKMRVAIPASIRDDVAKAISPVMRIANARYRASERKQIGMPPVKGQEPKIPKKPIKPVTLPTPPVDGENPGEQLGIDLGLPPRPPIPVSAVIPSNPTDFDLEAAGNMLMRVARPDEQPVVERVLARARSTFGS